MDGTREYNAKWNKSVRERQIPFDFTHLRNKTKWSKEKRERETEQTDGYQSGDGWGGWVK